MGSSGRRGGARRRWRGPWSGHNSARSRRCGGGGGGPRPKLADAPGFISSIDDALARHAADDDEGLDHLEISLVFRPYQLYIARRGLLPRAHGVAAQPRSDRRRGPPRRAPVVPVLPLPGEASARVPGGRGGAGPLRPRARGADHRGRARPAVPGGERAIPSHPLRHRLLRPGVLRLEVQGGAGDLGAAAGGVHLLQHVQVPGIPVRRAVRSGDRGASPVDRTHGHGDEVSRNEASISILNHCDAAHRLHLHLHVPNSMNFFVSPVAAKYSETLDYESILVGEIPKLPNITALTVTISTWSGHLYAARLASLIAQCVNLEELHIDVKRDPAKPACSDEACLCNNEGGWENQNFSLEHLQNLDITGVQGLDYENRLVQMMLAGAPAIE